MKVDTYKCDGCGTQKGETNHWFRFGICVEDELNGMSLATWVSATSDPSEQHLCSDACVIKAVQIWLSEQKANTQSSVLAELERMAERKEA